MGLYDQVNQTNTPFMSQFVGSIVPELNAYSGTMQKRYDTAADSDDALGEALGNLQHLGLDADTQYANELKSNYYQRLQERASSGDFENMGRRTRQDAIRFSQAYQPLIQRQKDYAEVVKKIQSDDKIADPATKQALIQQFQYNNTLKRNPTTGDFQRDGSGRIQLGGIQDAVYAPDVDKDKIISELLEKKKADIRQNGYTSDGMGHRVSSIDEVLKPESMAALSDMVQRTNPGIAAMINRDVELQTYKLTPDQIKDGLESSGLNRSEYQQYKAEGHSDKEIAILAKHKNALNPNAALEDMKSIPLARGRQQYIDQGYTPEAADRVLYNAQVAQGMRSGTNTLMGNLFSVNQHKVEERNDEPWLLNFRHNLDQADRTNVATMTVTNPGITPVDADAHKVTVNAVTAQQALDAKGSNLQAAIKAGLQNSGLSTGDSKKDMALMQQYLNDPSKTAQLAQIIAAKNPDAADALISAQKNYMDLRSQALTAKANTEGLEKASGIDTKDLYNEYLKNITQRNKATDVENVLGKIGIGYHKNTPMTYTDFTNSLRNPTDPNNNFLAKHLADRGGAYSDIVNKYNDAIEKGMKDYTTKAQRYHSIESLNGGDKFGQLAEGINQAAQSGSLQVTDINNPDNKDISIPKLLGKNPTKESDRQELRNSKLVINRELSPDGKITATVYKDGSPHIVTLNNLDPAIRSEAMSLIYKSAGNASSPEYAKSNLEDTQAALGESAAKYMPSTDLYNKAPSQVRYPLNDNYKVQVKTGGTEGKRYQVYAWDQNSNKEIPLQIYNSVSDLYRALGVDEYNSSIKPSRIK